MLYQLTTYLKAGTGLRRILPAILILVAVFSITSCSMSGQGATSYKENRDADLGNTTPLYERLVEGIGQDNTDQLYVALGSSEMDVLSYGSGVSNIILLVNLIDDVNKLIAIVGSDYPVESPTGLGASRVVALMNTIDAWMTRDRYDGQPPANQDTVQKLADFINGMSLDEITGKVVALIDALGVTRNLSGLAVDQAKLDKMGILISHTTDLGKVVTFMKSLTDEEITSKLSGFLTATIDTENIVEIYDNVTDTAKIVELVQTASVDNISNIINIMHPKGASKLGYLVDNAAAVSSLVYLIDNVEEASHMADLINEMEDNSSWDGQIGSAQNWVNGPSGSDSGMVRLNAIINGLAPAKLAVIMNEVSDMTKMMRLIQDVTTAADMVTLIGGLVDGIPCQNLAAILENVSLENIPRMRTLVDGQRNAGRNVANQPVYMSKIAQFITSLDNAQEGPLKVVDLLNGVNQVTKIVDLVYDVTNLTNLSNIINGINKTSSPAPNHTAVDTLVYMVEYSLTSSKLVAVINNVAAANVKNLVNNVAEGSQLADNGTTTDTDAAGKKLNSIIDGTTDITNLVFLLNNVTDFGKMADLMNTLKIASTPRVATLLNNISGTNTWNPASASTAAGIGKIVNMVDNTNNLSDVAALIDGIAVAEKLSTYINDIENSSLVVGLINSVSADVFADASSLVGLMNGLTISDILKVSRLITDLNGTRDALVARLLADYSGVTQGVGYAEMVLLFSNLTDVAAAGTLAAVLGNINAEIKYLNSYIDNTEGMVRFIKAGVLYNGTIFPGIGGVHIATLMNIADGPEDLTAMINSTIGLELNLTMIGCGDKIEDPDFNTPCTACYMGW